MENGQRTLICDTNCFYYLGNGTLTVSDIINGPNEKMFYTPVTIIELSSKLSTLEYDKRKKAATGIQISGATVLPDPQSHLALTYGLTPADNFSGWDQVIKAIVQSKNLDELHKGVKDYADKVVRTVAPSVALQWREQIDKNWVKDMLKVQKVEIPGFKEWYDPDPEKRPAERPVPKLTGTAKDQFLVKISSRDMTVDLFRALTERAYRYAKESKPLKPDADHVRRLNGALDAFGFYMSVYCQYLISLITDGALPKQNDSGDMELMVYSTDDSKIIVTAEKKWERLASLAGYSQRIRRVIPRSPNGP